MRIPTVFVVLAAAISFLASTVVAPNSAFAVSPIYAQRIATSFDTESVEVPASVRQAPAPTDWDHWEKGPVENLKVFAKTPDGVVWLGSSEGAARFDGRAVHPWDRWQYFWGRRWLPDNDIRHIVVDTQPDFERVWIRTKEGVSRIDFRPMTLTEKAAHFDAMTEARHLRHDFVVECHLARPGDVSNTRVSDNDNDGLWTAMYLAAECYRFAATGDADARDKAARSLRALVRLETITPVEGFFARSYRTIDEPAYQSRGGEWHPVGDGKTEWKGDTSSDEQVGHYYAYSVYFDLVANANEKKLLREHVRRLTDYFIDDGDELRDIDGKPTRWGRYSEAYYGTLEGQYEKALRSVELLSYLKTTYHITGDEKYQNEYLKRVHRGDAHATRDYRRWTSKVWEINYSDDELYYLAIDPLLKYENDPVLREIYLDGLRFTWSQIEPEKNALWNYISAARGGGPLTDAVRDDSRRWLERTSWDMIDWRVRNSHRRDVGIRPIPDRHGQRELNRVLPPDERRIQKHNSSPYWPDGGGNGSAEEAPTIWLLPYWMGRHEGFVE